jgi:hypothetical protein
MTAAGAGSFAGDKKQKSISYAVVAGTVFRDPGFALPGAEVTLICNVAPEGVKSVKPQKMLSDARGEFGFRVPPGKASYKLAVKAQGFSSGEKQVEVAADERVDTYFSLKPTAP